MTRTDISVLLYCDKCHDILDDEKTFEPIREGNNEHAREVAESKGWLITKEKDLCIKCR
jgi:hypothetical protein